MNASLDLPFCRRLTLVRALSILFQTSEMQRRLDVCPLNTVLRDAEPECDKTAFPEYGYLSSVEKTERFARAIHRVLRAKERGAALDPVSNRYCANYLINKLTMLRQRVDRSGIPYDFFAVEACRYWISRHNSTGVGLNTDTPELEDLLQDDLQMYVKERWANSEVRLHYPLEIKKWDIRFRSKRRRNSSQHQSTQALIVQRVADSRAAGQDGSSELRRFLPLLITEDEAACLFGSELVSLAKGEPRGHARVLGDFDSI